MQSPAIYSLLICGQRHCRDIHSRTFCCCFLFSASNRASSSSFVFFKISSSRSCSSRSSSSRFFWASFSRSAWNKQKTETLRQDATQQDSKLDLSSLTQGSITQGALLGFNSGSFIADNKMLQLIFIGNLLLIFRVASFLIAYYFEKVCLTRRLSNKLRFFKHITYF